MSRNGERGAVAVLVALMMVLIFVCVALVVDIGHIHSTKVELQRAVDAAVLAAAQELPAGSVVSTAEAFLLANQVDKSDTAVSVTVTPGSWNSTIAPGETAAERFTSVASGVLPNAVKVAVSRTVRHFFFFFTPGTTVSADAIAVAKPINPVVPLAMVNCVTPGEEGTLPDMTIAGIASYEFAADDRGAWTSLTMSPATAQTINDLIVDPERLDEFNSIIYGKGLSNDGIENTAVASGAFPYSSSYAGCSPDGLNIPCGLGRIAGKEIAAPAEFEAPPNLGDLNKNASGVYTATAFDPLTDFGSWKYPTTREPGALPRWYHLNDLAGLQSDDYFARLLTQDGILLNTAKLQAYHDGTEKPLPLGGGTTGSDRARPSPAVEISSLATARAAVRIIPRFSAMQATRKSI